MNTNRDVFTLQPAKVLSQTLNPDEEGFWEGMREFWFYSITFAA